MKTWNVCDWKYYIKHCYTKFILFRINCILCKKVYRSKQFWYILQQVYYKFTNYKDTLNLSHSFDMYGNQK